MSRAKARPTAPSQPPHRLSTEQRRSLRKGETIPCGPWSLRFTEDVEQLELRLSSATWPPLHVPTNPAPGDAPRHLPKPPRIELRRETAWDELARRVGLEREIHVGDDAFDAVVQIASEAPDDLQHRVLALNAQREAALELLTSHWDAVILFGDEALVSAIRRRDCPEGLDRDAMLEAAAHALLLLADALPWVVCDPLPPPRSRLRQLATPGSLALMLFTLGVVGLMGRTDIAWGLVEPATLLRCALLALAVNLLGGLAAYAGLRGRRNARRRWLHLQLLIAAATFAAAVLAGPPLNEHLDTSPSTRYTAVVRAKAALKRNDAPVYTATLRYSSPPVESTLELPQDRFDCLEPGQQTTLQLRSGLLGLPWIEAIGCSRP